MEESIRREAQMGLKMEEIIKSIVKDWKYQVKDMSDSQLSEDRSYWMKNYGDVHNDSDKHKVEIDIHTITIELEQLRRFGSIYYRKPKDKKTKRITEE